MGLVGSAARLGLVMVAAVVLGAGCGSDQFAPPPGLKTMTTSESAPPSKTVYMVIPGPPDFDIETLVLNAQREAGYQNAIFRVMGPGPGDPPSKQGETIRRAVGDGAEALVVIPNDDPETAAALAEVAEKGVAVVLLGRAVAPKEGKPPYILVVPEPFAISAKTIVETALADASKNGRPGDGEALIIASPKSDIFAAERLAALKAAAEAAKCRKVEVLMLGGNPEPGVAKVVEMVKARPDLSILLAEGEDAMKLAMSVRRELKGSPLTFVGGYAGNNGQFVSNSYTDESAFVEFRPDYLARLAIKTAVAKLAGDEIKPVITQAAKFNRGSGTTEIGNMAMEPIGKVEAGPVAVPPGQVPPSPSPAEPKPKE